MQLAATTPALPHVIEHPTAARGADRAPAPSVDRRPGRKLGDRLRGWADAAAAGHSDRVPF